MKTLEQIIEETRDGGRPTYDELRYAVCALEALSVFTNRAISTLAEAELTKKRPFMTNSAMWQLDESIRRNKTAYKTPPKTYIGWDNDPDNPLFVQRRRESKQIMKKIIGQ